MENPAKRTSMTPSSEQPALRAAPSGLPAGCTLLCRSLESSRITRFLQLSRRQTFWQKSAFSVKRSLILYKSDSSQVTSIAWLGHRVFEFQHRSQCSLLSLQIDCFHKVQILKITFFPPLQKTTEACG